MSALLTPILSEKSVLDLETSAVLLPNLSRRSALDLGTILEPSAVLSRELSRRPFSGGVSTCAMATDL